MDIVKLIKDVIEPLVDNKDGVVIKKMPTEDEKEDLYLVVADSRSPRDGRFIEEIGYYQPTRGENMGTVKFDSEKAIKWIKQGAQPTDTVKTLLSEAGILKQLHDEKKVK